MKKINLLLLSIILVGCHRNNQTSSLKYSGTWENIIAQNILTTNGSGVSPFNTSMNLRYFISDDLTNKDMVIEDIKSTYQNSIGELHRKFDRHNSYYLDNANKDLGKYTNIKDVNNSIDTGTKVKLDEETFNLLKLGVEYTIYTDFYFNIFVGELTDYWDRLFSEYNSILSEEEYNEFINGEPLFNDESQKRIEHLVECIPNTKEEIDKVLKFNEESLEVEFNSLKDENGNSLGNISISVGGIAKGYATDIVKNVLLEKGYNQGYLFSGGSSISSLGEPIYNNSKGQYLTVVDPRTASSIFDKKPAFGIYLKEEFNMSTSGNYTSGKSYTLEDNQTGELVTRHHIINNFTGYPEYKEGVASVSVFSKTLSAGILDAFSTTLVNKTIEEGLVFRNRVMNDSNLGNPDLEIIYIKENLNDNTIEIISTSNFNNTLEKNDSEGITLSYV